MTSPSPTWPVVWITGASSGIGAALALKLAAEGSVVAASARSKDALLALGRRAEGMAGRIEPVPLDVTDQGAVARTVGEIEDAFGPIDLAVFCAGTYIRNESGVVASADHRTQHEVNFFGVVHGLQAYLETARERAHGHAAVVASLSGYRGLPRAAAYGASKAALINLCEALKLELRGTGVAISLINPGFVKTPLTERNEFPMPFLVSVDDAVRRIIRGLRGKRFEIAFPKRLSLLLGVARILPYRLYFWLAGRTTGV